MSMNKPQFMHQAWRFKELENQADYLVTITGHKECTEYGSEE